MNKAIIRFNLALITIASMNLHGMSIQIPTTFALKTALIHIYKDEISNKIRSLRHIKNIF